MKGGHEGVCHTLYSEVVELYFADVFSALRRYFGYSTWVCLSVCLSVCLLSHISPMERLFVLKTLPRTQRATKVKIFVGICLKRLRSGVVPRNMSEKANMLMKSTKVQTLGANTICVRDWSCAGEKLANTTILITDFFF